MMKGHFAGEVAGHHDHPGDPEKDNVKAGDQDGGRQELLKTTLDIRRAFGVVPDVIGVHQGGEGHKCRREPGIEHIGVTGNCATPAGLGGLGVGVFF